MAKFTSVLFLLLAGVICVQAIVIELQKEKQRGKFIVPLRPRRITLNDPRCRGPNGLFPNPKSCRAYYACKDGTGQDRDCPKGMTFHSRKFCTFDLNEECGSDGERRFVNREEVQCPEEYGIFVHPRDCRKYVFCDDGVPDVRTCPEKQLYQLNVGCTETDKCPQKRDSIECRKPNGLFPVHGNCKKYIKCTNWKQELKECPSGEAFDAYRKVCKPEKEVRCKTNNLAEIAELV